MGEPYTLQDPRDNAAWHALRGPLAAFAQRGEPGSGTLALRFDPAVSVFSGVDRLDGAAWAAQARLVGLGGVSVLFRDHVPRAPAGWEEQLRTGGLQLEAHALPPRRPWAFVELGAADAAEMLALAELTEPGPFLPGTHRLGRYVGVRRGGRLIAMAGERLRVPGHVEVSAVCTHPDARGEGLAGALTLEVAHAIHARGERAFLHVLEGNEPALRLYERLGFVLRRRVELVVACWHDDGLPADQPRTTEGDRGPGRPSGLPRG